MPSATNGVKGVGMLGLERGLVWFFTQFVERDALNLFFRNPQNTAILIGAFIAVAGGVLGTFLLLRGMALTSDAISHTVLLGIVVAFMIMLGSGGGATLSSPWLLIGAAAAGVGTVVLTEVLHRTGLLKQDAALGLAFPLLFAVAVLLVSRYIDDAHVDEHSVMVGEIGIAWANTNSHALGEYESVTITPDDPRATLTRQCTNCRELGITPRDPQAEFREICTNCGEYSPAQAYQAGFTDIEPELVFWPESVTLTFAMMVLTLLFVLLFYKELKLSTFDHTLAKSLGFRPTLLLYALMTLVSLVAVGAFDAVGSILVIAFFIIPAAAAYLLTDRLPVMLVLSGVFGTASAWLGYDLARGEILGFDLGALSGGGWDTSISASMVVMMLVFFLVAFVASPRYGVISAMIKRAGQRARFEEQVLMGHVFHHTNTPEAQVELRLVTLPEHIRWPEPRVRRVYRRLIARSLAKTDHTGMVLLTEKGRRRVREFWSKNLAREAGAAAGGAASDSPTV
ncbi:MAG: metal ABC transporter permease [Spirochaetales bacterium]|nr:metal ABC transporter permease [Spirochaetales bacterium]